MHEPVILISADKIIRGDTDRLHPLHTKEVEQLWGGGIELRSSLEEFVEN